MSAIKFIYFPAYGRGGGAWGRRLDAWAHRGHVFPALYVARARALTHASCPHRLAPRPLARAAIRVALKAAGVEFEDQRVSFPEFGALKPTLPAGQLPVLEVDGTMYTQSGAILRWAGKKTGL